MTSKRNEWLGDKETIVEASAINGDRLGLVIHVHVMHRRKKNPRTGKIHHYGWIHFNHNGGGVIEGNKKLRRLAHAILKSIGDIP